MQYTDEQTAVIDSRSANIIVNAFAGTGKTTTLRGYASARPQSRILYLAFNKAMASEAAASFPENVACRTIHSMAYSALGHKYKHKIGQLRANDITRYYSDVPLAVADILVKTLESYMYSASGSITIDNTPADLPMSDRERIASAAQFLWRDMTNAGTHIPLPHDGYLKLYQLSAPQLGKRWDIILLDEAQDTNPVTADIVFRQKCGKVLVGDRHQSIYGFRGNINVMEMLPGAATFYLTQSMRFGDLVANAATMLLQQMKGETHRILGKGVMAQQPDVVDYTKPFAIISRTNAGVFERAVQLLVQRRVYFTGGLQSYLFGKLRDIHHLWADQKDLVQDGFYRSFEDFEALSSYGRDTQDMEVLSLVSVVRNYKSRLPTLMQEIVQNTCENPEEAGVFLLTAHRSKGLQFDQVVLDDDYQPLVDKNGNGIFDGTSDFEQEINLLYVALTRAKHAIQFNKTFLDFIAAVDKGSVR